MATSLVSNLNLIGRGEIVPADVSGVVYTVSRLLGADSTLSFALGSDTNLSLVGTGVRAATAIGAGLTQLAIIRETLGPFAIEYPVEISGFGRPPESGLPATTRALMAIARSRFGTDFSQIGMRGRPAKRIGVDPLPSGVSIQTGNVIRLSGTSASTWTFSGWDFSDYTLYPDVGTVRCVDCRFARYAARKVDIRSTASVILEHCEFDGEQATVSAGPMIVQAADGTTRLTVQDSLFHGSSEDCIRTESNALIERCAFYDGGYFVTGHFDFIQGSTGPGTHAGVTIRDCIFDGDGGGPVLLNNAIRLIAQAGGIQRDLLIERNVMTSPNVAQPPLAIGNRTEDNIGAGAENIGVANNLIGFATASPIYSASQPTGGINVWHGNRRLSDFAALAIPSGYGPSVISGALGAVTAGQPYDVQLAVLPRGTPVAINTELAAALASHGIAHDGFGRFTSAGVTL